MSAFAPGERVMVWQGSAPYFAEAEVITPGGQAPDVARMSVRYIEAGHQVPAGALRREYVRSCYPITPNLEAWQQARRAYAEMVHTAISVGRQRGIPYNSPEHERLPEAREVKRLYQETQRLEKVCQAEHPLGPPRKRW